MRTWVRVAGLIAILVASCGNDDSEPAEQATTPAPQRGDDDRHPDTVDVADWEPRVCDGSTVICVDRAAEPGGDGAAGSPMISVSEALTTIEDGGVVQVAEGVYLGGVQITKTGVGLYGGFPSGNDFTTRDPEAFVSTIDAGGDGPAIYADFIDDLTVDGFTLTGGAGVCFEDTACDGGGASLSGENLTVSRNRIVRNRLDGGRESNGAGLDISGSGTVYGNLIAENHGGNGAGLIANGAFVIAANRIADNEAPEGDHGGGAYVVGTIRFVDNHVSGNAVGTEVDFGWGGGVIIDGEGTVFEMSGNTITANSAPGGEAGSSSTTGPTGSSAMT